MPHSHLRRLFAFAAALAVATLVLVLAGRQAQAGTLQVRDEARVLASDDVARLRSVVASAPFDGRLVLTSEYADMQDLSRYVGSLVSERDQVVVGVDPQHHHVQVHFGTGASIPVAARNAIERAGNDAFRRGDWEGGAAAIFREAAASVAGASGNPVGVSPEVQPSAPGLHTAMLVLLGVFGIALLSFLFRRRTAAPPFVGPGGPGYGPPYQGGGYGYGPQQGGGMGPLGGGLLGAGLGGLAGYELGKMEGERERNVGSTGGGSEGGGGNFDGGGGGSDWDDGGGGGGGGGFDGGGGDSGGGGSDF